MDSYYKASKRIPVPKTRRQQLLQQQVNQISCPSSNHHNVNQSNQSAFKINSHHNKKSVTSSSSSLSTPASRTSSSSSSDVKSSSRTVDSPAGRLVQDLRGGEWPRLAEKNHVRKRGPKVNHLLYHYNVHEVLHSFASSLPEKVLLRVLFGESPLLSVTPLTPFSANDLFLSLKFGKQGSNLSFRYIYSSDRDEHPV